MLYKFLFIFLINPFFIVYAQVPTTHPGIGDKDEVSPLTPDILLRHISIEERRLKPFLAEYKEEKKTLDFLSQDPFTNTSEIKNEIDALEFKKWLRIMPLENLQHKLAQLHNKYYFKPKDIPALREKSEKLLFALDNTLDSTAYSLTFMPSDKPKNEKVIKKLEERAEELSVLKDTVMQRIHYLTIDQVHYDNFLKIAGIKGTIKSISASLSFLDNMMVSKHNALAAEFKKELRINDPTVFLSEVIDIAQEIIAHPLGDQQLKNRLRVLMEKEEKLRNSAMSLLLWKANEKKYQLYRKLLELDPHSTFDINLYLSRSVYFFPPSMILNRIPVTTPGI